MLRWALTTIAAILVALAGWIRYRFGPVSFEQVVTNLPIGGAEGVGNNNLLTELVVACLVAPIALTTISAGVLRRLRRRPAEEAGGARRPLVVPSLALSVALGVLLTAAGVPQYAAAMLDSRSIADYYIDPAAGTSPAKPRNLITIYLESMENSFANEDLFGENLLAGLDRPTAGWADYPLNQYPGGGWTMSGIVSTQCAVPLKSKLLMPGVNSNSLGEKMDHYLPGAECLGDVLADRGYTNAYVGGANTRFAGKDTFLADHGYTSIQGLANWEARGEDRADISIWGLSDARTLSHARETLADLRAAGEPFHLTVLTLDTHEPAGLFDTCGGTDAEPMATAVKCSLRAVGSFLDHLRTEGYLDDTVVVVMGDHLKNVAEGGTFSAPLADSDDRTILFRVWSPDGVRLGRKGADQLSVLPTVLELLGLGRADGRAGLGVSFAGTHDLSGTAAALPPEEYRALIAAPSGGIYQKFWRAEE